MPLKIVPKKSPLERVQSHLGNIGHKLHAPYQNDGVEWLVSRESKQVNSTKLETCVVCYEDINTSKLSKRDCCKAPICMMCIEKWETKSEECPHCRSPLNYDIDGKTYGGLLCDEMGLGKTLQMISLTIANPLKHTLIVLPSSLIDQWICEFGKFAPQTNIVINYGNSRPTIENFQTKKSCVVITSYGMIRDPNSFIYKIHWDRLILDECHEIRNPKSKICKAVMKIHAINKWGITGTPIQNYKKDLITLLEFLGIYKASFSNDELTRYVSQFVLRRTKSMVEQHNEKLKLPELKINKMELEFASKEEKDFYNKIRGECSKALKQYKFDPVHAFEVLLRLRQVSILPQLVVDGYSKKDKIDYPRWEHSNTKLDSVVDHLRKNHSTDKTIIFVQFRGEMTYLRSKLEAKGLRVDCINGGVSSSMRYDIISKSRRQNNLDVLLVQINAGGTGLNLQHFNVVYFTSPSWNPALKDQAIARSHRIGQTREVQVYMPLIKDTIDHRIFETQKSKSELFKMLIDIV